MPLTNLFEPLFLLLALLALGSLLAAAALGVTGRWTRAWRILKRLGIGAAIYVAVAMAASVVLPPRVFRVGEAQCFDDWCITVTAARRPAGPPTTGYEVTLRLSNRARGVPMGEKGTVVYLTDSKGRRYNPLPDPADIPFETRLQPGEWVLTTRRFDVPRDTGSLGLVYRHEGGIPIEWLIITEGGWFQPPPVVRLH